MGVIVNEIGDSCSEARLCFLMPGGGSGGRKNHVGFRMGGLLVASGLQANVKRNLPIRQRQRRVIS